MRILIYGAGVIGCQMAHMLCKAKHNITLLARGEWRKTIDQRGLIIKHYVQLHTTVDKVTTIGRLDPDDVYHIIFVVMQHGQLSEVLPIIAENRSRYVVLVGNNMHADESARILSKSPSRKEVAFGFQGTGGRREDERVISVHAGVGMTVGGLHTALPADFKDLLIKAFADSGYRLTDEYNMDAWLKCHLAFILPVAYVCYATDFHLPRATTRQMNLAMDAALEGYAMLKKLGYPIRPADSEAAFTKDRKKMRRLLLLMCKTPLGRLAASDHCQNAGAEMIALDKAFETLRRQAGIPMPHWEILRREGPPRL